MSSLKKVLKVFILTIFFVVFNQIVIEAAKLPQSGTGGECGKEIRWEYLDNQWVYSAGIYIQGTGTIADYEKGNAPWFQYASELKKIVVCDGVTSIGENAFYGMTGLIRICISDTVTYIADNAFDGCSDKFIICAESDYIKKYAEKHGYQFLEGYAEPSHKTIKKGTNVSEGCLNYAITSCRKDTYEVSVIGVNSKKKKVVIPATINVNDVEYKVVSIAENAFRNNQKIEKIIIGKNISQIGKKAFYNCKKVNWITIKTSKLVKRKIGEQAFSKVGKDNNKKLVLKCPINKQKIYRMMLKKKGLSNKIKVI